MNKPIKVKVKVKLNTARPKLVADTGDWSIYE